MLGENDIEIVVGEERGDRKVREEWKGARSRSDTQEGAPGSVAGRNSFMQSATSRESVTVLEGAHS